MPMPDRWLVLSAAVAGDDPLRDLISEALLALGGLSILDEKDALTTYLARPDAPPDIYLEEASRFLADWIAADPPSLTWRWQPNEDWERSWRRGLRPRKVSQRFVVKPSWTEWRRTPGEIVIEIDPEMAFGTGEHPTTRGCLRLMDRALRGGETVLDIGSGSGILSIGAALAGAARVVAVEFDSDANLNARDNIERNAVADRLTLLEQRADPRMMRDLGQFDVVVANILSGVIRPLLPALEAALRPGGTLILSGILQSEAPDVIADASNVGLAVDAEAAEEEWWSGLLRRTASPLT